MAKQIVARQQGDDYQARWFWLHACSLLDDFTKVERVVYEDNRLKAFDDVAIYYRSGYADKRGTRLDAEYFQVKFHVVANGALTIKSLCDPSFINATKISLLQRVKDAHDYCNSKNIKYRLTLYTPWSVHPDDILAQVYSLSDGSIRLDKITKGGKGSQMGRLRRCWIEHLGLSDDDELCAILSNFCIKQGPTLDELGYYLNLRLRDRGLKQVPKDSLIHPYDDLTKKMLEQNLNELTSESLLRLCTKEGLVEEARGGIPQNQKTLGVRTFLRWAEDMENQTESMICLSHLYEGRRIKDSDDWNTVIPQSIVSFVKQHITRSVFYRLHLDTHLSVAFLLGHLLPEKMGIKVDVVQHSSTGTSIWRFDKGQEVSAGFWRLSEKVCHREMPEFALAIGITHDITDEVLLYVQKSIPSIGRVIQALPASGACPSAVRDGGHAEELTNELIQYLRTKHMGMSSKGRLHIFSAAPNGFIFCLGRKMQPIPYWTFYEYDFGSGKVGAYSPSITNSYWR